MFWLSRFYNKSLLENINFDILFNEMTFASVEKKVCDPSAKSKVILNGTSGNNGPLEKPKDTGTSRANSVPVDDLLMSRMNVLHEQLQLPAANSNQLYPQSISNANELNTSQSIHSSHSANIQSQPSQVSSFPQINIQQITTSLEPKLAKENNLEFFTTASIEQPNSQLYQAIKDITFLSILIIVLFYKLRHLFHNIILGFESSWKVLASFERDLESSFLHENFFEFLQNEFIGQRNSNQQRAEQLQQELAQLEKISKIIDKELETEMFRFVEVQNQKSYQQVVSFSTNRGQQQYTFTSSDFKSNKSGRPCPECGKVFHNAYKLNRHLYVHKDPSEKPYMCDWSNCTYRSISRNDLNRHKMIHTGEKPYLCDIEGCDKRYSRPDKLRHHKQTIHFKVIRKKSQICIWPGCNFQCVFKSELNRHQLLHSIPGSKNLEEVKEKKDKHRIGLLSSDFSAAFSIVSNSNQINTSHLLPSSLMLTNNSIPASMHSINLSNSAITTATRPPILSPSHLLTSASVASTIRRDSCSTVSTSTASSSTTSTNHRLATISVWPS